MRLTCALIRHMKKTSPRQPEWNRSPKADDASSNLAGGTRAAIYARISENDPKVEAVADQEKRCRELAERESYTVVAVFADDGISAFSGKSRPAWLALNDGVRGREFDIVLAVAEDRLSRNAADKIGFQVECAKYGVTWHTLSGGKVDPSTAGGALMSTLTGGIAQYESHIKRERVQASVQRRLAEGKDLGGIRPFGFEQDRETIREPEAALIREAHRMILTGGSVYGVAQMLQASGFKTTRGGDWRTTSARALLLRPRNAGLLVHKGVLVAESLTALVSREDHDAVVAILTDKGRDSRRGPKTASNLASGVAVCGVCGSWMRANTIGSKHRGKTYSYQVYRCNKQLAARGDGEKHVSIRKSELDKAIRWKVCQSFDRIASDEFDSSDADRIGTLRAERADLNRRREVVQELLEEPDADSQSAMRRIRDLGKQIRGLDAQITAAMRGNTRSAILEVARERAEIAARFDDGYSLEDRDKAGRSRARMFRVWDDMSIEDRQRLTSALYRVVVNPYDSVGHHAPGLSYIEVPARNDPDRMVPQYGPYDARIVFIPVTPTTGEEGS